MVKKFTIYYISVNLLIQALSSGTCQQGQYNGADGQCVNCDPSCSDCYSSSMCNGCKEGYFQSPGDTFVCSQCTSPCKTCSGSSTNCQSCVDGFVKTSGSNCQACQKPCLTCQNTVTYCLSCIDSTNQSLHSCNCKANQYMDTTTFYCHDCVSPCLTCSSTSVCLSCVDGYLKQGNSCNPCTKPCKTCNTSVTTCSTCIDNINQAPSWCNCKSGYIMNTTTFICSQCTYPCATCQNTVTNCLTCASTYTLSSSTCICLTSQYEATTSPKTCVNCSSVCLTCNTSSNNCTSCDSSIHRIQSGSTCVCMDGYYESSGNCVQCTLPCKKCLTSATNCTLCNDTSQILSDCHCPNGYFNNSSNTCQKCQSPCDNCSSLSNCLSCINTKYLSGTSCLSCSSPCVNCVDNANKCLSCIDSQQTLTNNQCICNDGYYMDSSNHCLSCSHPCSKCQSSSIYCTECKNTFQFDASTHNCFCQTGDYENTTTTPSTCNSCQSPCKTCQTSASHCLTCVDINQTVTSSNTCECNQGWLASGNSCVKCHISCTACQTSTSNCTICKDPHHINNSGTCDCQPGYLNDSNYNCVACTSPCATCSQTTTHCLTCTDTNHQINASNECICKDTYYSNTISTCAACTKPCNRCNNLGCLDCVDANQIINTNKECICNNGYVMVDVNCYECQKPCTTCIDNINKCLTCIDQNQNLVNNTCVCKDGYYSIGNICGQCQLPCTKCVGDKQLCSDCLDPNQILINQKCICKPGFGISTTDQNLCSPCQYACLECSISPQTCLSCVDKGLYILQNSGCVCNSGYYQNDQQCWKCAPQCQTCADYDDNCMSCTNIQFNSLLNQCNCQFGYYQDTSLICKKCQSPCLTCTKNYDICTSCDIDQSVLNNNKCSCIQGYYYDGKQCNHCNTECTICENQTICNQCIDGYYLNQLSSCIQCKRECSKCIDDQICLTCISGYILDFDGNCKQCFKNCQICSNPTSCDQCISGYYLQNLQCNQCDQNCQTCENSATNCLTCKPFYIQVNNQCLCDDGYYEENFQCLPCQFPCIKCLEINQCQSCAPILHLSLNSNNFCECESNYFWNDNLCQKCDQNCLTCIQSSKNCVTCDKILHRILSKNICVCDKGYFEDEQLNCIVCHSEAGKIQEICQYQDCQDGVWTYGEQCDDGNNIIRDGCSNCQVDPYYSCKNNILEKSICFQCPPNCAKCTLNYSTNVTQCNQCQSGFYLNSTICNKCDDRCLECGLTSLQCTKCRFLSNKSGQCQLCEATTGYYSNFSTNKCDSKCGDSILVNEEDCDDGNLIDGDGCNHLCKYESKYLCKDGICITPQYPEPILQEIGDTSSFQSLRQFVLTYDQLLKVNQTFEITNFIKLFIEFQRDKRSIDQNSQMKQEIQTSSNSIQIGNLSLYISLNITKSSTNEYLLVSFKNYSQIESQFGYSQQSDYVKCKISPVVILDSSTINQVQAASQSNQYMLYFILAMVLGSILFGGIDIFYNLLDTLQMLSYFKYINTIFPYNLQQFLNLFGFAQLNFISKYLQIEELIDYYVDFQALPSIPPKISADGFNSLFIINAASILSVWLIIVLVYYSSKIPPKIFNNIQLKYYSDIPGKENLRLKLSIFFLGFKIYINKICFIIVTDFFFSGVIRVHLSTAYDYAFSVVLQLYSIDLGLNNFIVQLSQFFAAVALSIYMLTVYLIMKILDTRNYCLLTTRSKIKFGALFEGVAISRYTKYFNPLLLVRKFLFMAILIFMYYGPLYQIMNLILLSFLTIIFLIQFKPLEDYYEYIKQLSVEISIYITQICFALLIIDDNLLYFSQIGRQNVGWGCIICISTMLIIQIVVDTIQQWILLFRKFKAIKKTLMKFSNFFKQQEHRASHNIFNISEHT